MGEDYPERLRAEFDAIGVEMGLPGLKEQGEINGVGIRTILPTMVCLDNEFYPCHIVTFSGLEDGKNHFTVVFGDPTKLGENEPVPMRVHARCFTGDNNDSMLCDCGPQLHKTLKMFAYHISLAESKGRTWRYI